MTAPAPRRLKDGKLPGVLRRRLLSALLDRPGRVVSPEELARKVWPDGPPPRWRVCLAQQATYVNRQVGAEVVVRIGNARRIDGFRLGDVLSLKANLIRGERPARPRRYDWTPAEDRVLRENVGRMTLSELTAAVNAVHGRDRRPSGVEGHLYVLGLSKRLMKTFTGQSLSRLFGVEHEVVTAWLAAGLMRGSRTERDRRSRPATEAIRPSWWRVDEVAVERFIRAHPWEYDWRSMRPDHHLTALARAVQARAPWLAVKQARKELRIGEATMLRWMAAGRFPNARRVTSRYSTDRACWRIPMADILAVRASLGA